MNFFPFTFLGVAKNWKALNWTKDDFLESFPDRLVTVQAPQRSQVRLHSSSKDQTMSRVQGVSYPFRWVEHGIDVSHVFEDPKYMVYHLFDIRKVGENLQRGVNIQPFTVPWAPPAEVNLWLGTPTVTTPLHFDFYHNFYTQVRGRKRFILVPAENYQQIAPFPHIHPSSRMTKFDLNNETFWQVYGEQIRSWKGVREIVLEPGDALYIPPMMFHYVCVVGDEPSVSVSTHHDATIARFLVNALGLSDSVHAFMPMRRTMYDEERAIRVRTWLALVRQFVDDSSELQRQVQFCVDSHWDAELLDLDEHFAVGLAQKLHDDQLDFADAVPNMNLTAPFDTLPMPFQRRVTILVQKLKKWYDGAEDSQQLHKDIVMCSFLETSASYVISPLSVPSMLKLLLN